MKLRSTLGCRRNGHVLSVRQERFVSSLPPEGAFGWPLTPVDGELMLSCPNCGSTQVIFHGRCDWPRAFCNTCGHGSHVTPHHHLANA